jgi:hypothetical protein
MKLYKQLKQIDELNDRIKNTQQTLKELNRLGRLTPEQIIRESSIFYKLRKLFNIRAAEFTDPLQLKPLDFEREYQQMTKEFLERSIRRDLDGLKRLLNN